MTDRAFAICTPDQKRVIREPLTAAEALTELETIQETQNEPCEVYDQETGDLMSLADLREIASAPAVGDLRSASESVPQADEEA